MQNSETDPNSIGEHSVRDLIRDAQRQLAKAHLGEVTPSTSGAEQNHRLDVEVLLLHVLKKSRAWLYAHPEATVDANDARRFYKCLAKRVQRLPVAYIIEHQEFWSLDFTVTPAVLVPRPETELLVELVLNFVVDRHNADVLELGTGSGAISIALHSERPDLTLVATDVCVNALEVARKNKQQHQADSVQLIESDWFQNIPPQQFDVVVSNPPYIAQGDKHLQLSGVCWEPRLALTSGNDGLDAIRHIARHAKAYLKPGGQLFLEHGYDQAAPVAAIFQQFNYQNIKCHYDHADIARITSAAP